MTAFLAHGVEAAGFDVAEKRTDRRTTRDDGRTFAVTEVSSGQRCVTVALHGELNATTALLLFGQLAFFCVGDPWEMVVDLGDVTAIDDDGITALIDARQALSGACQRARLDRRWPCSAAQLGRAPQNARLSPSRLRLPTREVE